MDSTTTQCIERFSQMVASSGGELTLLSAEADLVRVGYRPPGAGLDCEDGSCLLPAPELQQLMTETIRRLNPSIRVEVEARP